MAISKTDKHKVLNEVFERLKNRYEDHIAITWEPNGFHAGVDFAKKIVYEMIEATKEP